MEARSEARSFPEYTDAQVEAAQAAAQQTTPYMVSVTNYHPDKIYLAFIGCHGSGNPNQRMVARLMNDLGEKFPLSFKLFGGDNFYPDGAETPVDDCFNQLREYDNPEVPNINKLPGLPTFGNHCGSRDTASIWKNWIKDKINITGFSYLIPTNSKKNEAAEQQQIAHSLLIKPEIFGQDKIAYQDLSPFFIPHYFYGIKIEHFRLCVLNSNTYAAHFLHMMKDLAVFGKKLEDLDEGNQAVWYQKQFQSAQDEHDTIFTLQHHPLVILDKRGYEHGYDAWHYLDPLSLTLLNKILNLAPHAPDYLENVKKIFEAWPEFLALEPDDPDYLEKLKNIFEKYYDSGLETNGNYNKMLHDIIFIHQKITVKNYLVAHSHNMNYFNNNNTRSKFANICQITSGAGGETLQNRLNFGESDHLGGFLKEFGCVVLEVDKNHPENFNIYFHTVNGQCLHFNNQSSEPLQAPITDERTIDLRKNVLRACQFYEKFLNEQQNKYHGKFFPGTWSEMAWSWYSPYMHTQQMVFWLHEIKNYFNQPVMPPFADVMAKLAYCLGQIKLQLKQSFDHHPFCTNLETAIVGVTRKFQAIPEARLG